MASSRRVFIDGKWFTFTPVEYGSLVHKGTVKPPTITQQYVPEKKAKIIGSYDPNPKYALKKKKDGREVFDFGPGE